MKDLDMEDIPRLTLYNKADLVEDFTPTQTPYALISAKSEDSRENLQALFLEKIKDIFETFTLRVPFQRPTRFMIWKVLRFWKNAIIRRTAK